MQQCFCIKGVPGFDFYIKVLDTQTIVFNNLTEWVSDNPYVIPETFQVDVVLPDSSVKSLDINSSSSTIIRSSDININRFKDGIYCFKIDGMNENSGGCGLNYTKIAGIFPNIECCIDDAYSKLDDDKFSEIMNVQSWIKRAKNSASLGKEDQSLQEWRTAKKLLQSLNCECNC